MSTATQRHTYQSPLPRDPRMIGRRVRVGGPSGLHYADSYTTRIRFGPIETTVPGLDGSGR
jgi:hypothetical protein